MGPRKFVYLLILATAMAFPFSPALAAQSMGIIYESHN